MKAHWSTRLPKGACTEAVEWCRTQPSMAVAWRDCEHDDWMQWILIYGQSGADPHEKFHAVYTSRQWRELAFRLDDTTTVRAAIIRQHFPRPPRLPA